MTSRKRKFRWECQSHLMMHLKPSPVWACAVCGMVQIRELKPKRGGRSSRLCKTPAKGKK
jgi:hypothetical protein